MVLFCYNPLKGSPLVIPLVLGGRGGITAGLLTQIPVSLFRSWVCDNVSKAFWIIYDTASFLFSHCMMSSDTYNIFFPLSLCLRTGEVGYPLYNRAEGGHKDCQQREALRICSNEGAVPTMYPICLCICPYFYLCAASPVPVVIVMAVKAGVIACTCRNRNGVYVLVKKKPVCVL